MGLTIYTCIIGDSEYRIHESVALAIARAREKCGDTEINPEALRVALEEVEAGRRSDPTIRPL